jgi:hypothetical protein
MVVQDFCYPLRSIGGLADRIVMAGLPEWAGRFTSSMALARFSITGYMP